MRQKILEELGLTAAEAKIYLILLEQGASLAGMISRNTGIHRRSVYDAIERLIQKGLVSYIKTNNRKYFEAVSPDRLLEILQKREEDVKSVLPELKKLSETREGKNETLFFRGKPALKSAFDDQLDKGNEICIWGANPDATEIIQFYFPRFDKQRVKKGIRVRMILDESHRSNKHLSAIPLSEVRFVPDRFRSNTSVHTYGRNVCIVSWRPDPVAILVREENIAEGFKSYFEFMWSMAKK